MENLRLSNLSNEEIEESKKLLLFVLIITISLHAAFLISSITKESNVLNHSEHLSDQIAVRVVLSTPKKQITKKKIQAKKSTIANKTQTKTEKTDSKLESKKVVENIAINKNLGTNTARARYLSRIRKLINENKIYPKPAKRLKHQGRVKVELMINAKGDIISTKYLKKSHSIFLNGATEELFKNVKNVGHIPKEIKEIPLKVIVPINYQLI